MKIFLKQPGITSDNKEDEEQSHQPSQPSKTTGTKSLLSKKTKSTIVKTSPSTAKASVKTRSKTKSNLNSNKSSAVEVSSSSSKSASSDAISSPYVETSAETLPGGAASLAANVSSTITTMLNAKLHVDASSSTPRARSKIREGERASDQFSEDYSMSDIQERTLEVIAAYEEIGNAFKKAAIAVERLKTILPPGINIVIPQLPVTPEIPESQSSAAESANDTPTNQPSANAASSASKNASIQNILNDTSSDSTSNDNVIWEYGDVNSPAWAGNESPLFVNNGAEKDTSSPFSSRVVEPNSDINKNARNGGNGSVKIINNGHFGTNSESSHSRNNKESNQHEHQNQFNARDDKVEREAPVVVREPVAKIGEGVRTEGGDDSNVNNRESKKKGRRSRNLALRRITPYTTSFSNKKIIGAGIFDYSNTKFTDEEIFILEEFNKYYERRVLSDRSTKQSKVATEISSMAPKVTFEQTAVSKLVRRVKVPKDPATIKALEKWISNERAKEGSIEQES